MRMYRQASEPNRHSAKWNKIVSLKYNNKRKTENGIYRMRKQPCKCSSSVHHESIEPEDEFFVCKDKAIKEQRNPFESQRIIGVFTHRPNIFSHNATRTDKHQHSALKLCGNMGWFCDCVSKAENRV